MESLYSKALGQINSSWESPYRVYNEEKLVRAIIKYNRCERIITQGFMVYNVFGSLSTSSLAELALKFIVDVNFRASHRTV
jgi:hypothetical protein